VLGAVGVAVSRGGGDSDDISQPSPTTSAGPAARPVVASAAGMAAVPAGAYPLGVGGRSVQLEAFHLDRLQVSNAQYARFLQAVDGAALPADWDRRAAPGGQEDRPVVGVGWTWAKAYCMALGKDLPTEAEWEAAARGTAGRPLPWGDDLAAVALPPTGPYPVGSVAGNVTPEGVQDLVGNVWEWVREPYEPAPERQVVRRGGRSGLQLKGALDRQTVDQTNRSADAETGFRCAAARVDPAAEPDVFQTDVPHEAAPAAPAVSASTGFDIDDSFEDPASGWPRRPSAEETAAGITVGYHGPSWYHLEMRQPGQREVLLRGVNYADAELTVTAYVLRQAQAGAFRYGLVFRAHPFDPANTADAAARQENFYAFAINPSTQQWELLHTDTAPFRVVASGALPEGVAVSDETKPDELGVELRGQALVMRINGGEVGQFRLSRQHPTGDVGFFLENLDAAGVHVHFDRITARAL
ncbi:MAG: formylglycine-generating enzyme family protein, partial [Acidimicrobiales bacterium]